MEKRIKLPASLCDRIFTHEFQIDTGTITQELLTDTVQLYVEAISFYTSLSIQKSEQEGFDPTVYTKRSQYYQQKIKRLLVRSDVQGCLTGKKSAKCGHQLQKQIALISENAPGQVKALVEHYRTNILHQEKLIANALDLQKKDLNARIQRRSKSKNKKFMSICELDMNYPTKTKRSFVFANF